MNRNIYIAVVGLFLAAGGAVVAQDTNAVAPETNAVAQDTNSVAAETNSVAAPAPAPAPVTLQSLAQKNIFDPSRSPRRVRTGRIRRQTMIRTFTFCGTVDDNVAIFTGEGAGDGLLKTGSSINGFKVMKVPQSYGDASVMLTDPSGAIVTLNQGDSMRREDDGPWNKTDQPAPETAAPAETTTGDTGATTTAAATPSAAPAGESDILKRLRLKREQEDK